MMIPGLTLASEEASELYVDGVLTGDGHLVRFDRIGSVSALRRDGRLVRLVKTERTEGAPPAFQWRFG